jgi:hypothetical protein
VIRTAARFRAPVIAKSLRQRPHLCGFEMLARKREIRLRGRPIGGQTTPAHRVIIAIERQVELLRAARRGRTHVRDAPGFLCGAHGGHDQIVIHAAHKHLVYHFGD